VAILENRTEIVSFLVEHGANMEVKIEIKDLDFTALHLAVNMKNPEIVKYLIEKGADIEAMVNDSDETALYRAVSQGQTNIAKILVENGATIEARSWTGMTALHWAIDTNHLETVQYLLEVGADVNAKGYYGNTALHFASFFGEEHDDGPGLDTTNGIISPSHLARPKDLVETVKLLKEHGANVNERNKDGETPLHLVCSMGRFEVVKYLIAVGNCCLETCDNHGRTALHVASCFNDVDVVKYLVQNNAALETRDDLGCTALHLASAMGKTEVVKCLSEKGAYVNATSNDGMTALHFAVQFGRVQSVVHLMKLNGCTGIKLQHLFSQRRLETLNSDSSNLDTCNDDVILALQLAVAFGHSTTVKDLMTKYY
jgi:ankyrin repeat protein